MWRTYYHRGSSHIPVKYIVRLALMKCGPGMHEYRGTWLSTEIILREHMFWQLPTAPLLLSKPLLRMDKRLENTSVHVGTSISLENAGSLCNPLLALAVVRPLEAHNMSPSLVMFFSIPSRFKMVTTSCLLLSSRSLCLCLCPLAKTITRSNRYPNHQLSVQATHVSIVQRGRVWFLLSIGTLRYLH